MSETRSYRPGDWFGIFGDQATVVLPPSEKARVPGLWALVDAGAGFDEVLDALIADGLRDLPGFVLVSEVDGETKVVLRSSPPPGRPSRSRARRSRPGPSARCPTSDRCASTWPTAPTAPTW